MSVPYREPGSLLPGGLISNWSTQVGIALFAMAVFGQIASSGYANTWPGRVASAMYFGIMALAFTNAYLASRELDEEGTIGGAA